MKKDGNMLLANIKIVRCTRTILNHNFANPGPRYGLFYEEHLVELPLHSHNAQWNTHRNI